ncbi:MAG: helix-turn-helix domain-containing protein [Phycisphaerales bacterium]|nr:helix-turn-helix domain-containing protein [Phycisphaerales bacterium]
MAKMFYTLDEAAARLKKSTDEVREMATSGQLQEFRDRDKLMFKVDQVDLLAGEDEDFGGLDAGDTGAIPLADSGMGSAIDLASSASGMLSPIDNPKERTGISVFDVEDLEKADPSAVTQMSDGGLDDATLEAVGSGSGLMDLTRESDDTSLGAVELLDEIYSSEDAGSQETIAASGLFEATGAESDEGVSRLASSPGVMMVAAEPYDGAGSGLVGGLALGAALTLGLAMAVTLMGVLGAASGGLVTTVTSKMMMFVGIVAGVTLVAGAVGFVIGKRG